jgi:nucleotide-binding universal stress UspA family protein
MFSRIVLPLDGSALAERALPPALALAHFFDADIMLVRVPEAAQMFIPAEGGLGMHYPDRAQEQARAAAWTYLQGLQAERGVDGLSLKARLADGDVASAIVDAAVEEQADLIVMSSHGYSGVTRWVLGSVAEKVLRDAACPVLIVRTPQPIQSVLIPLDGSPLAGHALAPALDLAEALGARVTLLRVLADVVPQDLADLDELERGLRDRMLDEAHESAQAYLNGIAATFARPGIEIATLVSAGPVAPAILKQAELGGHDLIAMATHGRTGLRRWIYGSVTEKVLHSAATSMLVVRPHEMR